MANRPGEMELHRAISFFNSHPDALTAMVKHRTDTKGHLGDLYIQIFDTNGTWIQIATRPPPKGEEVEIRIPIEPPLSSMYDALPLLKEWKRQAWKKFNVPETPPVRYFKRPAMFPFAAPAIIALGVLFFALWGSGTYADWLRERTAFYLGKHALTVFAWLAGALHLVIEPAYMFHLTGKHGTPPGPRVKWILWNMVVGFGALDAFWECISYERKRHIYRQTDVGDIGPNPGAELPPVDKQKKAE